MSVNEPSTPHAPSILVVEDDHSLNRMISEALTAQGYRVSSATTGIQGLKLVREWQPDILLLDMMLPHFNGLELLRQALPEYQGIVLMITASDRPQLEEQAFDLGVHDYIQKPLRPHILFAKLKALIRLAQGQHSAEQSTPQYRVQNLTLDPASRQFCIDDEPVPLTDAEFSIAEYLMAKPGVVLARSDIVAALRGIEYDGLDRAIDMRISSLRKKMHDSVPPYKYIKTVRGRGYMLAEG
ncbi:DNA-binding response regulator [Bacterioplanes sanyensis]|uniref:DNA-binding response regulator n=1 Tax=Bacterioplanes sanyensis TaxID=1249553 RepID=A0A222FMR2_9GAMM|nr:response regulator transcription factor [Bacterioplanes sanyensis]ASP39513.1 DNA-binding response regulator [Bacterioplanes sanyensis]